MDFRHFDSGIQIEWDGALTHCWYNVMRDEHLAALDARHYHRCSATRGGGRAVPCKTVDRCWPRRGAQGTSRAGERGRRRTKTDCEQPRKQTAVAVLLTKTTQCRHRSFFHSRLRGLLRSFCVIFSENHQLPSAKSGFCPKNRTSAAEKFPTVANQESTKKVPFF